MMRDLAAKQMGDLNLVATQLNPETTADISVLSIFGQLFPNGFAPKRIAKTNFSLNLSVI
jgi:hypothetical protein